MNNLEERKLHLEIIEQFIEIIKNDKNRILNLCLSYDTNHIDGVGESHFFSIGNPNANLGLLERHKLEILNEKIK